MGRYPLPFVSAHVVSHPGSAVSHGHRDCLGDDRDPLPDLGARGQCGLCHRADHPVVRAHRAAHPDGRDRHGPSGRRRGLLRHFADLAQRGRRPSRSRSGRDGSGFGPRDEPGGGVLAGSDATGLAGHHDRNPRLGSNVDGRGSDCRLCARPRFGRLYLYRLGSGERGQRFELCPGGDVRHRHRRTHRGCVADRRRPLHHVEGRQRMSQQHQESKVGAEIELVDIVKRYPGQKQPAVENLSLTIPAGEMVMFVGPSGCGKTTSLKMINRLIEPSSGKILIDGDDITTKDPTQLRRSIGYVIQGGGLMPHMTVADNIGLVPKLLKWDQQRIRDRVDELMEMTGLDPKVFRDRYPRELSGGQQQRVGVARGLAADPPVVLMDEPFGAVDPITRQRLQDELLILQEELQKTIVFVTHDVDEAVKLGDRILILQEGAQIAQYDTPAAILGAPANDFVADFIGAGSRLKQLSLARVRDITLDQPQTCRVGESTAEVVRRVEAAGEGSVVILDEKDRPREWVFLRSLRKNQTVPLPDVELQTVVDHRSTLADALDSMLTSSHGGAMVTQRGKYLGVATYDAVTEYLQNLQEEASA